MQSSLNILWMLLSAALVFLMQPGFMCLESGLTRSKNSINVAIKNLADFCFSVCGFWALGYGLMFGASHAGIIGTGQWFLSLDTSARQISFFLFQAMFCGTATTIFSGAVAERMRFSSYIIIACVVSSLIYPLYGHWAWAGLNTGKLTGLLGSQGFVDFAGSSVVHSVGGWVALAALLILGPRTGRFPENGPPNEITASNLPLSVLGCFLLWIGWFGFNGGSNLVMNAEVPKILAKTTLAGGAGAISCLLIGWRISGIPKVIYLINGALGGLVAITASCNIVSAADSIAIGGLAGVVCLACEHLLEKLKIDDAVGAVPVHLGCGIWGTLAVAFFGNPEKLQTGLSFGGQLLIQFQGIVAAFAMAFLLPYVFMRFLNMLSPMRVSPEDEHVGLNVSEHGAKTDLLDLFEVMQHQAATKDLTLRVPEKPFTEVGSIARMYNQVMEALERAMANTEAILAASADAIIAFAKDGFEIISLNPTAEHMFGLPAAEVLGHPANMLFIGPSSDLQVTNGEIRELTGLRSDGKRFPVEANISRVSIGTNGDNSFLVGLFRDISRRKQAEANYKSIFENAIEGIFQTTPDGRYLTANPALARLYGFVSPGEMIEHFSNIQQQLYVDTGRRDIFVKEIETNGAIFHFESEVYRKDGSTIWISESARAVTGPEGKILYYEGRVIDITDRILTQEALRIKDAHLRQLFESSPLAIAHLDASTTILEVNKGFASLFGYSTDEVIGKRNRKLVVPKELKNEAAILSKTISNGRPVTKETIRQRKDGSSVPVFLVGSPILYNESVEGIYYIYQDISQQKAYEKELEHQAFHDALTGLPNRSLFAERLSRAIARSEHNDSSTFAVMLLDLDRFKWINDSLGHPAGDRFLQEIANRMSGCLRAMDTLSRQGGDEFGILLEDLTSPREVITIARRILSVVREPYDLDGFQVSSSASIGIVLRTDYYDTPEKIIRDADIAMYRAKDQGKDCLRVFNKRMLNQISEEMQLENELRRGMLHNEFILYFQPILTLQGRELKGLEALIRWNNPTRGLMLPDSFIPLAEESGVIIPLGKWVLTEACSQLARWKNQLPDFEHVYMSVNISRKQFLQPDLAGLVSRTLQDSGLPPSNLRLEITETAIMNDVRTSQQILEKLKNIGVRLAIDDFGTGYSSLSYLQQFPVDVLKIDKSFISGRSGLDFNPEIVKTIIRLGQSLGLDVVAEGIKKSDQMRHLLDETCPNGQGFFFSEPVNAQSAQQLLKNYMNSKN